MLAQAGLLDLSHRLERGSVSESLLGFLNVRRQRTKQIEREDQHLLDFEYDQANIESFRNLWGAMKSRTSVRRANEITLSNFV